MRLCPTLPFIRLFHYLFVSMCLFCFLFLFLGLSFLFVFGFGFGFGFLSSFPFLHTYRFGFSILYFCISRSNTLPTNALTLLFSTPPAFIYMTGATTISIQRTVVLLFHRVNARSSVPSSPTYPLCAFNTPSHHPVPSQHPFLHSLSHVPPQHLPSCSLHTHSLYMPPTTRPAPSSDNHDTPWQPPPPPYPRQTQPPHRNRQALPHPGRQAFTLPMNGRVGRRNALFFCFCFLFLFLFLLFSCSF